MPGWTARIRSTAAGSIGPGASRGVSGSAAGVGATYRSRLVGTVRAAISSPFTASAADGSAGSGSPAQCLSAAARWSLRSGLERKSSIPTARQRCRSLSSAFAVSAMIGRWAVLAGGSLAPLPAPDLGRRLEPIHDRHLAIHQDRRVRRMLDRRQHVQPVLHDVGGVAEPPQHAQRHPLIDLRVLGNQDAPAGVPLPHRGPHGRQYGRLWQVGRLRDRRRRPRPTVAPAASSGAPELGHAPAGGR